MTNETIPVRSGIRGLATQRRIPRIGKVRLGTQVPNKSGNGTHPVMSEHFVFDDNDAGRTLTAMFAADGPCVRLPIAFPSDDPDAFAQRNLEFWGASTLKCKGDGEIAEALVNIGPLNEWRERAKAYPDALPPENLWASTSFGGREGAKGAPEPERHNITCFGLGYDGAPACPMFDNGCKATLHLQFVVRGFPGLGIFQIDTGSVVNLQRVDDFLAYLGQFTGGRYAMVPLWLTLEPYQMKGGTFYGLNLNVDFAAMQGTDVRALTGAATMSVPERVMAYLPEATREPVTLPASDTEDDAPSDTGGPSVAADLAVAGEGSEPSTTGAAAAPSPAPPKAPQPRKSDEYTTVQRHVRKQIEALLKRVDPEWQPTKNASAEQWAAFWELVEDYGELTDLLALRSNEVPGIVTLQPDIVSLDELRAVESALTAWFADSASEPEVETAQQATLDGEVVEASL